MVDERTGGWVAPPATVVALVTGHEPFQIIEEPSSKCAKTIQLSVQKCALNLCAKRDVPVNASWSCWFNSCTSRGADDTEQYAQEFGEFLEWACSKCEKRTISAGEREQIHEKLDN